MDPITVIDGPVSVLDRDDVDTDQIIPKQFLKRVERTGFGEFVFYDWAKDPDWDLPPNPILATGRNFGCGSTPSARSWRPAARASTSRRRRSAGTAAAPRSRSTPTRSTACSTASTR